MGNKRYKPWTPEQPFLLPPSPLEWLPEGHLAHFILDVVSELDLSAIEGPVQAKDPRGTRPYDPTMMTTLLLYGYCVGVFSSRKLERATYEDVAFRMAQRRQPSRPFAHREVPARPPGGSAWSVPAGAEAVSARRHGEAGARGD